MTSAVTLTSNSLARPSYRLHRERVVVAFVARSVIFALALTPWPFAAAVEPPVKAVPSPALSDSSTVDRPTEADLSEVFADKVQLIDRMLTVVEAEIVPLTQRGVRNGNKLFGGAILRKSDLSTVVAVTNSETGNPLLHGEITAINAFYEIPREKRPAAKDCIFICTHEPCPLCLSGITWAGFDNFFYLFSYEDTKDAFNIPHDLRMLEEIFRVKEGDYARKNDYWSSWGLKDLIETCDKNDHRRFTKRIVALRKTYDQMSDIYQQSKDGDADIPLK